MSLTLYLLATAPLIALVALAVFRQPAAESDPAAPTGTADPRHAEAVPHRIARKAG